LDNIITRCEKDNDLEHDADEEEEEEGVSLCTLAQFLLDVMTLEEEKHQRSSLERRARMEEDEIQSFIISNEADTELAYSDFFVNYQETKKSVLITDFPNLFREDEQKKRLETCLESIGIGDVTEDSRVSGIKVPQIGFDSIFSEESQDHFFEQLVVESLDRFVSITNDDFCPLFNVSSDLNLPRYVANDYINRISFTRFSSSRPNYQSFFVQATVVHPLDVISVSEAMCPASLHALYVIVDPTDRVNTQDTPNASIQSPLLARVYRDDDDDLGPMISIDFQSFPRLSKIYRGDGWAAEHHTNVAEVPMRYDSALFVPSGSTASFQGIQTNDEWKELTLLRFCFADASNLNEVKQHLRAEATIDSASKDLLLELSDPSFDITVIRDVPSTLDWNSAFQLNTDYIGSVAEGQSSVSRRLSKNRRQRGTFANWQLGKSWDHKVIGLTLPIMAAPIVLDYGRRNVTLSWMCPFVKKPGDVTDVGYIISWEGHSQNGALLPSGNLTLLEPKEDSLSDDKLKVEFVTDKRTKSYEYPVRKLTGTVYGLNSDANYTFKVAMMYGRENDMSQSLFSFMSKSVRTESPSRPFPLSSPPIVLDPKEWDSSLGRGKKQKFVPTLGSDATMIVLEMRSPHDDGGLDLKSYDVMRAHTDSSGHRSGDWVRMKHGIEVLSDEKTPGGLVCLAVHDLLPGASYKFKVAARNDLGQSGWSASSSVATTHFSTQVHKHGRRLSSVGHGFVPPDGHHVYGVGVNHMNTPDDHNVISPILVLDDSQQTITRSGIAGPLSAWACFWSPRGFKVSAETSKVTWGDNGEVLNQNDVEYRIAIVGREEGRPFAHLALAAQRAGALAIIIVDNARCDDFDQYCIMGYSKSNGDMWGELDLPSAWADLKIPTMFVLSEYPQGRSWDILLEKILKRDEHILL